MLKFALAAAAVAFTVNAQAETYVCTWTEPFVSVSFDDATGVGELADGTAAFPTALSGLKLNEVSTDKFELVDASGSVMVELALTNNGSDGMSDFVYPYDAVAKNVPGVPADYLGACSSESKPVVDPFAGPATK